MILAITGGTGFVGSHVIDHALDAGYQVRALARRPQPSRAGVTWIAGDLARPGALAEGAAAVLHVAGVTSAPDRAAYESGNAAGTASLLAATQAAGVRRFVAVSSLAAREPRLSAYGASKAAADALTQASALDWTIVRPPAIFGPRDHDLLELFRLARRRVVPLPPAGGRLSVIAAADLARLLVTLATGDALPRAITEPDDGTSDGWDHRDFARAIGAAVGRRMLPLPLPRPLLGLAAVADRAVRGPRARLTPDRVAYFCHPDWTVAPGAVPPADLWQARIRTPEGLAETARWYCTKGWL